MCYFQTTEDSFFFPPSPKDPEAADLSIIVGEEEFKVAHFRYFRHSRQSRQAETREYCLNSSQIKDNSPYTLYQIAMNNHYPGNCNMFPSHMQATAFLSMASRCLFLSTTILTPPPRLCLTLCSTNFLLLISPNEMKIKDARESIKIHGNLRVSCQSYKHHLPP